MKALTESPIPHMLPVDIQETNERRFAKKHLNKHLDAAIRADEESEKKVKLAILDVKNWLEYWTAPLTDQTKSEKYWKTKKARLDQVAQLNIEELVRSMFVGICYVEEPQLLVSVTAQLAMKVGFDDKREAILTMAELVAICSNSDAYDIYKVEEDGGLHSSVMIQNKLYVPPQLREAIKRSQYLPPMVCEPDEIIHNWCNGHLTFNDSLILGRGNEHDEDVCLDVINTQNQIPLKLDVDFLSSVEEEPNVDKPLNTPEKQYNWDLFKYHSYHVYLLIAQQGNKFYLTNKVDTRLRLYSQGYHINTQGAPFKKAMIEFADEEIVTGVPT